MKIATTLLCLLYLISCKNTVSEPAINQAVIQDYNDLFSKIETQKLSEKIINFEKLTTNQICVYTIDSIPNNNAAMYHATNLSNTLGVGVKGKDNGLLILISKFDRQVAITTGTGTEEIITDAIANQIISKTIIPKFKDSLYFEGVSIGLDSIISKWNSN